VPLITLVGTLLEEGAAQRGIQEGRNIFEGLEVVTDVPEGLLRVCACELCDCELCGC
jgi:hypothetical protein